MHLKFPTTAKRDTTLNNIIKSLVSEASLYHVMNEVAPTFLVQMFRFNIWLRREFYSIREFKVRGFAENSDNCFVVIIGLFYPVIYFRTVVDF